MTRRPSHPLVSLAAHAIAVYLADRRVLEPPAELYEAWPEALRPAGVFVCLKHEGRLRGCIGTIEPLHDTVAIEVVRNAIGAATRDPRFDPVQTYELTDLSIAIDILGPCEPVPGLEALDPARYGLMLKSGEQRSVLLPSLEGINSVMEQVAAARAKAGLAPDAPVELFRFTVQRFS
ncbi:MAG: AmmeMemoRadiSam system protein A [Nitrospirota bacterium]|nr:AmmeMemoRadiSam system protein A [Nitrospirota bacterium]MDE3224130.1 AmmeMemoRadiSam system protein A [Nitrospirota bacterium]MDE3243618.1 AmmeMemoRadiSam system protein A [Nitrospirota bacterium]